MMETLSLENLDISKIRTYDDVLQIVGSTSFRNIMVFILCTLPTFMNPLLLFTYTFIGYTPGYWCYVEKLQNTTWTQEQIKNISIPLVERDGEIQYTGCTMYSLDYSMLSTLPYEEAQQYVDDLPAKSIEYCSKREFEDIPESVVTKWDLVCERRVIYATTQSCIHIGILAGGAFLGYILDKFGRLPVYRVSVVAYIVSSLAISLSPTVGVFIVGKFISAFASIGCYMASFVLAVEFTSVKQRALVSTYWVVPWSLGVMASAGISYLIRPWYYLQLALTLPNVLQLFAAWYLSESPRWLITQGKHTQALAVLGLFAEANGRSFPDNETTRAILKKLQGTESNQRTKASMLTRLLEFIKMYISLVRSFPKKTLMLFFCWFTSSMVYYSISLGSTALSSNDYLYIFLGGAVELVSYLGLWPAVVFLGRRRSLIVSYMICAVSITVAMVLVILVAKSELAGLKMTLFLVGKFAITANFHLLWVYTAELYPTTHRSLAVGQGSTVARMGSTCSSYLNDILGAVSSWAPSAVFGGFSLFAGIFAVILPETDSGSLQDTFQKDSKSKDTNS